MKTFKSLVSEKKDDTSTLKEGVSISKLKRLNLVNDTDFSGFIRVMKKMDNDQAITLKEKDIVVKVFNELLNAIVSDQSLLQKVAKRGESK